MITDKLISDLRRDERVELKPYRDTVGKLTIGVGRNLDDIGISDQEADILLMNDILEVTEELDLAAPWWRELDEPRGRALCNMRFNLGLTRLLKFEKMLEALKRGDYQKAADEALDSRWSRQVGQRALRIAHAFRTGEDYGTD